MKLNDKKGISLIVLVITIIVMIVLATAIILSLSSNGIIGKANEAQQETNTKTLYEAASVKLAEYELETSLGNLDKDATSANDYVKEKLNEQGIDTSTLVITKDGKILVNLTKTAVRFLEAGIEVGTIVTGYDLSTNTITTYTTSGNENTAPDEIETTATTQDVARATTLIWKYIGINEKGEVLIALETYSNMPTMKISGKGGYLNGEVELNLACAALYSSDMGKARSMDINDALMILGINPVGTYDSASEGTVENPKGLTIGEIISQKGETLTNTSTPDEKDINTYVASDYYIIKKHVTASDTLKSLVYQTAEYWLASSCIYADFFNNVVYFQLNKAGSSVLSSFYLYSSDGASAAPLYSVRPVVELEHDIEVSYQNGIVKLD